MVLAYDFTLFRYRHAASPAKPDPNKSMVEGSGMGFALALRSRRVPIVPVPKMVTIPVVLVPFHTISMNGTIAVGVACVKMVGLLNKTFAGDGGKPVKLVVAGMVVNDHAVNILPSDVKDPFTSVDVSV